MRVAVIGAGVAGAATARTLRRGGAEPIVLEAADGAGGRTRTFTRDGFAIDSGAIFVMGSYDRTLELVRESGGEVEVGRWEARTMVLDERGWKHRVRFDRPWTLLCMPQLGWGDRVRLAGRIGRMALGRGRPRPFTIEELAAADDGSTLADWARRTFGERGFEYAIRPLMDPLTGADPERISAAFTIALMHRVTRAQLTVPDGGLGSIVAWMLEGVEVRYSTPVRSLSPAEGSVTVATLEGQFEAHAVVVATDVLRAASLLEGLVDDSVLTALRGVTPIPARHVLLGYEKDPWPECPYDLVVRAGPGVHHNYGALLNGRRAPSSVPAGGQTVSIYFDHAQCPPDLGEDEVLALACEATEQAFGPAAPDFHRIFSMNPALIAPTPGHYASMLEARDAMPERIRLAGDFLTHSGIEGALLSGEHAARELLQS